MFTATSYYLMKSKYNKAYRAFYSLTAHMVLVTKYRKPIFTDKLLTELEKIFASILSARDGELLEFNGEKDHVHLLVSYKPSISVSNLVANLKATSSKMMWRNHADYLKTKYYSYRRSISKSGGTIEKVDGI